MNVAEALKVGIPVHMLDFKDAMGTWAFEFINHGGCGIVASAIAEVLEEYGIEHGVRVVNYDGRDTDIEEARNNVERISDINDWDRNGVSMNHVIIDIDGQLIDSTGDYNELFESRDHFTLCKGKLFTHEIRKMSLNDRGWNPEFNRDYKWVLYYAARTATIETLKEILPEHPKSKTITIH